MMTLNGEETGMETSGVPGVTEQVVISVFGRVVSLFLLCVIVFSGCTSQRTTPVPGTSREEPPSKPNIVLIMTDDQGYADADPYGAVGYSTPHLNRMAHEGMVFTDYYTQNVCTPARAAILTGSYPRRNQMTEVLFPEGPGFTRGKVNKGLHPDEVTIADMLKPLGYRTACIGKWHLGHRPPFLPTRQGFDTYFGLPYSNDMKGEAYPPLPLMKDEQVLETNPDQSTLTRRYTEQALEFIRNSNDRPFFLYLAHSMPHVPLHASERFRGTTEHGIYGDVIREIDWSVGQVLKILRERDIAEDTLVLFTSDNGPWTIYGTHAGSTGPLRGAKSMTFDGGHRVPFIAWWPGTVPAGTVNRRLAASIDLLPTIAHVTGASRPDYQIDGKNIYPLLTNPDAESPRDTFLFYKGSRLQAIRHNDWKLHLPHRYRRVIEPGDEGERGKYGPGNIETALFHLRTDKGEQRNVASDHPEMVRTLKKKASRMDQRIEQHRRPVGRYEEEGAGDE